MQNLWHAVDPSDIYQIYVIASDIGGDEGVPKNKKKEIGAGGVSDKLNLHAKRFFLNLANFGPIA